MVNATTTPPVLHSAPQLYLSFLSFSFSVFQKSLVINFFLPVSFVSIIYSNYSLFQPFLIPSLFLLISSSNPIPFQCLLSLISFGYQITRARHVPLHWKCPLQPGWLTSEHTVEGNKWKKNLSINLTVAHSSAVRDRVTKSSLYPSLIVNGLSL